MKAQPRGGGGAPLSPPSFVNYRRCYTLYNNSRAAVKKKKKTLWNFRLAGARSEERQQSRRDPPAVCKSLKKKCTLSSVYYSDEPLIDRADVKMRRRRRKKKYIFFQRKKKKCRDRRVKSCTSTGHHHSIPGPEDELKRLRRRRCFDWLAKPKSTHFTLRTCLDCVLRRRGTPGAPARRPDEQRAKRSVSFSARNAGKLAALVSARRLLARSLAGSLGREPISIK